MCVSNIEKRTNTTKHAGIKNIPKSLMGQGFLRMYQHTEIRCNTYLRGLENRRSRKATVGSNPTLSARRIPYFMRFSELFRMAACFLYIAICTSIDVFSICVSRTEYCRCKRVRSLSLLVVVAMHVYVHCDARLCMSQSFTNYIDGHTLGNEE